MFKIFINLFWNRNSKSVPCSQKLYNFIKQNYISKVKRLGAFYIFANVFNFWLSRRQVFTFAYTINLPQVMKSLGKLHDIREWDWKKLIMLSVIIKIILALEITLKDFKHPQQFLDYTLRTSIVQNSYKKPPHK